MKKIFVFILWLLIFFCKVNAQEGYWFQGNFIELEPDNSQYYVQFIGSEILKVDDIKEIVKCDKVFPVRRNGFVIKTSERPISNDLYVSELYKNTISDHIIILPSISFETPDRNSASEILKKYSSIISLKVKEGNVYRLNSNLKRSKDILEVASQIYHEKNIKWCEPVKLSSWHSSNPLYSQQYYLKNTGQGNGQTGIDVNAEPAWNLVLGNSDITVAVIDEGIDPDHEDLSNSVLSGYTVDNPFGYGIPQSTNFSAKGHGVACAGIIGAEDNNKGIKGVASGVKLLPVNIVPENGYYDYTGQYHAGFAEDEKIAKAIVWASSRADILSCSWGGGSYSQDIVNAIDTARIFGRGGKGCVVVFASGNGYEQGMHYVSFPACANGVIAVGAIDNTGNIWDYSQGGPELTLVAPSGDVNMNGNVVTTDRMGTLGYDSSNYTYSFGGTSAACPQVAGVAALVLSANPNLTQEQVKQILQCTARKLPDMFGENRTDDFGYGLVDAYGAVLVAQNWQDCNNCTLSGSSTVCSYETYTLTGVPSNVTVSWRFEGQTTTSPQMYPNSSNNTCGVNLGNNSFKGYLCADVQLQGYTMVTYKKLIEGGNNFIGYYWDDTEYMDVLWSDDNWVTPGHTISVHSEDLAGKTAKISRSSSPSNYTYLNILGPSPETRVEFYMPYLSNGEYLTLWISGTCGDSSFKFYAASSRNNSNLFTISEQGERRYMLSLSRQDVANNGKNKCAIINSDDDYWVFRVYNAATMQQVATELVKGDHYLLDATSWKSGIYIIRAYIGKVPYTAKISVK